MEKIIIRESHHFDAGVAKSHIQAEKIDWFRVIVDLERSSYPHNAIAAFVGVSRRAVGAWKSGSSPRYEDGEMLIALWSSVTGQRQDSAPKVKRHSFRA